MANELNKKQEENIHGFTGDMKEFLRSGDFESALILIDDLKKYVLEIHKERMSLGVRNIPPAKERRLLYEKFSKGGETNK